MSEALAQGPVSGDGDAAALQPASAGTLLRLAREAAGLHVATLASALKVPVRKLESLEADRYDELSDVVFVRALAASVCRNLKVDPAPVLQRLPATGGPRLAADDGRINAPFHSPRDGVGPSWLDQLSKPVYLIVFALLLGAVVVALLPAHRAETPVAPDATMPPPELATMPPPDAPAATTAAPSMAAAPVVSTSRPAVQVAQTTAVPVATAAAPVSVPAPAASAASVVATPSGIVVFKARGESWIQVTDARGAVALRKLLAAGESAAASGALPLTVTVGSVSATEVQVRGNPFDMAPVSRDNVARFEVK